jgi:Arc/MetJ family transcription regulator
MPVRTTLDLDDELLSLAREYTGIRDTATLVHTALRQLIEREAAKRLAALGGSMPDFQAGRRRRSEKTA